MMKKTQRWFMVARELHVRAAGSATAEMGLHLSMWSRQELLKWQIISIGNDAWGESRHNRDSGSRLKSRWFYES